MADVGAMLANYGSRGGLLNRLEQAKTERVVNRLNEIKVNELSQQQARGNQLRDLYGKAVGGDQDAMQGIAQVDPKFHLDLQTKLASIDDAGRKRLAEEAGMKGRLAFGIQDDPNAWQQNFPNVPYEERGAYMAKLGSLNEALFKKMNPAKGNDPAPYYSPMQTQQGMFTMNARTGEISPATYGGSQLVGAQYDPSLQGELSGAKAAGKAAGEAQADAQINLGQVIQDGDNTIRLVDELLNHPGFNQAVGKSSLTGMQYIPGTKAKDFMLRLEQLKGKQFLEAFQSLKGGGQITEVEGNKATQAISRMDNAASEEAFITAAREFQNIIRQGVARAKSKATGAPAAQETAIDDLVNKYAD